MTTIQLPYGGFETNPLPAGHHDIDRPTTVDWNDPQLARITRLRVLADPGCPFASVSYCHGELVDGTAVEVELPVTDFKWGRKHPTILAQLVALGRQHRVYVKRLIQSADVISVLC